jgi:HSP20 family protein
MVGTDFYQSIPAANVYQDGNKFKIDIAVPGFSQDDFSIDFNADKIIFEIKPSQETQIQLRRKEYDFSKAKRVFLIPDKVDVSTFEAKYELGILSISADQKDTENVEHFQRIQIN